MQRFQYRLLLNYIEEKGLASVKSPEAVTQEIQYLASLCPPSAVKQLHLDNEIDRALHSIRMQQRFEHKRNDDKYVPYYTRNLSRNEEIALEPVMKILYCTNCAEECRFGDYFIECMKESGIYTDKRDGLRFGSYYVNTLHNLFLGYVDGDTSLRLIALLLLADKSDFDNEVCLKAVITAANVKYNGEASNPQVKEFMAEQLDAYNPVVYEAFGCKAGLSKCILKLYVESITEDIVNTVLRYY